MPRFVILEHDRPFLHWDFMLESGETLRTWRLLEAPSPHQSVKAEPLGDHRRAYLDYEGPVSGDRGTVQRWDAGTFEGTADSIGLVEIVLSGQRCRGRVMLQRGRAGEWTFVLIG